MFSTKTPSSVNKQMYPQYIIMKFGYDFPLNRCAACNAIKKKKYQQVTIQKQHDKINYTYKDGKRESYIGMTKRKIAERVKNTEEI